MIFHSIRWRLQLWHALILVAVLAGFGFTAFQLQHAGEMRRVDQELEQRVSLLLRSLHDTRPPGRGGPRPPGFRPTTDLAGAFGAETGF